MLKSAKYFIELALISIKLIGFKPSIVAAGALFLSCKRYMASTENTNSPQVSDQQMCNILGFGEQELYFCAQELMLLEHSSSNSSLQAVNKKYCINNTYR